MTSTNTSTVFEASDSRSFNHEMQAMPPSSSTKAYDDQMHDSSDEELTKPHHDHASASQGLHLVVDFAWSKFRNIINQKTPDGRIEPVYVQHATFDRSRATNEWSIEPKFLKEVTDHFGPSAEQLDIYSEHGKTVFTSFTTKIADGKGLDLPTKSLLAHIYANEYLLCRDPATNSASLRGHRQTGL